MFTFTYRRAPSRKEQVADDPVQPPTPLTSGVGALVTVQVASFHPLTGSARSTIRLPRRKSNLWVQALLCRSLCWQVNESPPVKRRVPDPYTLTYSPTMRGAVTADALAATSSPTRAAATTDHKVRSLKEPNRTSRIIRPPSSEYKTPVPFKSQNAWVGQCSGMTLERGGLRRPGNGGERTLVVQCRSRGD